MYFGITEFEFGSNDITLSGNEEQRYINGYFTICSSYQIFLICIFQVVNQL